MGTTTHYGWPYPAAGDSVDVPRDISALAVALDDLFWTGSPLIATGTVTMPLSGTVATLAVTYGKTFPSAPHVFCQCNTNAGNLSQWVFRAVGITTTGFQCNAGGPAGPTTCSLQWFAVLAPSTRPGAPV